MITSMNYLQSIREQYRPLIEARLGKDTPTGEHQILVCAGTGCSSGGSHGLREELKKEVTARGLQEKVKIIKTGCFGFCKLGPIAVVHPEGTFYCQVQKEDAAELVQGVASGRPVSRLLYRDPATGEHPRHKDEIYFFQAQQRLALHNCGLINPEDINEYIARDGYQALAEVLKRRPEEIIAAISASGLRGRGGAGFPTGRKWELMAAAPGRPKYVVCNADEGDPGAFMDRSILEGDPHSVLEGMTIAGYATGASQGYIYVRAEYPIAVDRLERAIRQARRAGLLGQNILASGFDFDIDIRLGAGAFVCGEETALLRSIEGRRGEPRPRPPYPAQSGLWGRPTVVNNVETLANVPLIIRNGPEWYAAIGTAGSKGTKVFSLAGSINNTGLIEVPMGTTLREIIFDIGGGIPNGKNFKAVQTGGPSGGCLPEEMLDTPVDYEALTTAGSIMGSGGLIVMDESDCMVDIARFYLEFSQDESCGRCTPCRVGTKRLLEILKRITSGAGSLDDLKLLEDLSHDVKEASLCGLGQTAPNPILSTLRYFRDEYEAHVRDKLCPAGVCSDLARRPAVLH
ncbi:NADP-reducing hydrogenase subunit HndC [Moorella thermoacetica]|uniref:NADP-reducing hydrogenase subunit HndC n=1 Tax=Neomoorella thermoacetica TaxID=1525 RepID=A0A1J5JS81_NEOTH|nr:NADH-quinone oxidoreductase subunit NuoF [Moorella thermoacetica]OIQ08304.1 NADP-reducing hydrogenase subunit HndC [Moorella thermoacetica]